MMILIAGLLGLSVVSGYSLVRWGCRWGSTADERSRAMPGDKYLEEGPAARVAMTRAISIKAAPDQVWPWIAQLGRGAGFYSIDWLDNGRRPSAWHVVSWIPEPQLGDATAIGYLRHIDKGRVMAWWVDGVSFAGARSRLVSSYLLEPEEEGSRLISRMSADATGLTARFALLVFRIVDSIMAARQLIGIRARIEQSEKSSGNLRDQETGSRDQYQLYEVLYGNGGSAGVAGKEQGAKWRQAAVEDGVLENGGSMSNDFNPVTEER